MLVNFIIGLILLIFVNNIIIMEIVEVMNKIVDVFILLFIDNIDIKMNVRYLFINIVFFISVLKI